MNWRGVVAGHAEAKLTKLMNDYAENRMQAEAAQSRIVTWFGLASPTLAVGAASRTLAGTDLATHHRFLRESEALRFDFVQGLNDLHASALTYADDAARSSDPEAEKRTRVNAASWRLLDTFRFAPDPAGARAGRAALPLALMLGWLLVLGGITVAGARRLRP
jgi:ABC-2 type transport system permease protein